MQYRFYLQTSIQHLFNSCSPVGMVESNDSTSGKTRVLYPFVVIDVPKPNKYLHFAFIVFCSGNFLIPLHLGHLTSLLQLHHNLSHPFLLTTIQF
jgi:hypothetical protein